VPVTLGKGSALAESNLEEEALGEEVWDQSKKQVESKSKLRMCITNKYNVHSYVGVHICISNTPYIRISSYVLEPQSV
jgi:hypothetical protein